MPVEGSIGTEQEQDIAALLDRAANELRGREPHIPKNFVHQLFGQVAADDLAAYEPQAIADFARQAWAFLATRRPGAPKIRFVDAAAELNGAPPVSVIEIVNDDMPFLVDSVLGELGEFGLRIRLVAHPVLTVERDAGGELAAFASAAPGALGALRESFIHIHLDHPGDDSRRAEIVQAIEQVLAQVRVCVQDWRAMLGRLADVIAELKANPPPIVVDEIAEAIQFLEWLLSDNFTFIGLREYMFAGADQDCEFQPVSGSALGLLRDPLLQVLRRGGEPVLVTPEIRAFLQEPKVLIVTKANVRSRIHRRVYLDYIGVKRFDSDGRVVGEIRIVGLFTSTAYTRSARGIPYLRRKIDAVLRRAGFDPGGHSGKALVNVLETYPRDELFQIDEDTLHRFALIVLRLDERPRLRVLPRRDRFDRFVSILVYVPRERYDSAIRSEIGAYLAGAYNGRVSAYYPFFPEGPLVRVHYIIGRSGGAAPNPERAVLERAVGQIVRTWSDGLADALAEAFEAQRAQALFQRYRDAFSAGYREVCRPSTAVEDIRIIEGLSSERPLDVNFHIRSAPDGGGIGLKVWSCARPIPLSERVPVLENMGFRVVDERTEHIQPGEGEPGVWFHDMLLQRADGQADLGDAKDRLEALFLKVMGGLAEDDGYNSLVLRAGLPWRDIVLLRAISRFLRQISIPFSQDYMWATLRKHATIAAVIVDLFHARFDPAGAAPRRAARQDEIRSAIEAALQKVASLDEDRILRRFINAVNAALRTNFYQIDTRGQPKDVIAIKFDSRKLDDMPLPRPLYEIFVYSPRVEGVHLRFGKVARGGIRWSDRPQDFRTEILGLVKAQQVKNAVIVPVGAKGGFVPKHMPAGGPREAIQAEGVAAYKLFISALLDITDNLDMQQVVPPERVVRHDDDDPYLVVAADKGTATFSDIANAISIARHFWLGDAFASGGSAGYDHKKMGITARGAWEAVKRHFREMNVDIGAMPFTVAGVGDMSGDVFGNGMLRERTIKLVAAFDHRDIFLDPAPDPERSFAERKRLFDLPRSSWQDYDKALISKGGGVFPRGAKEIPVSQEVAALLELAPGKATPPELIKAILKMPVDLLWFGGIGTYVRASSETDDSVGDRANDAVRVRAAELRCKVIGEGANLGMTQRGRVEAAMHGIRLNTDAIDNSAGVNTSDVEVNIKIALSLPLRDGRLSLEARNALLVEMTEEVAALVLRNNYLQTLALSLSEKRRLEELGFLERLMQILETRGELDRAVEFLPDAVELAERRKRHKALTRPELAVLMAYAKLSLYAELLESRVPDDPYLGRELARYFPTPLSAQFPDALEKHRLRREIIATQLANSMINRGGPSLVVRIADQTGASAADIAAAFAAVRDSYGMPALNDEINALDAKIDGALQLELYATVEDLLLDRLVWFLRTVDLQQGLAGVIEHYRQGIEEVAATLVEALPQEEAARRQKRAADLVQGGVPQSLAQRIADLPLLKAAPDIVLVAKRTECKVADVTTTYFAAESYFRLGRIIATARGIAVTDYFDRLALDRALDGIGEAERRITAAMMQADGAGDAAVQAWIKPRAAEVDRIRGAVHEIAGSGLTLSKLTVAASMLGDLAKQ
ncbi:MAG TPA: NAD-glutamate dehydrogenase [Xanthobacteraceae bacterium]|nr:NAD-glutamate dehydrogenase [Xanthobacteraceae bacterium]